MKRLIPLLLAALLLTACSPTSAPIEEPDPDWALYQQGQEEVPPEPETPEYPATFTMAYNKGQTLDPLTCGEGIQQDVSALLFEPLFQLNDDFTAVPLLCEGYSWDESGLICTLTVRPGVTFSDGTELTAADIAASLRRAAASERYRYRLRKMASAAANREGQVIITLTSPDQGFPALLDIPVVKSGTEGQPVPTGTGPYLFVTASEGDKLLASDEWWQGKALPVSSIDLVHAKDRDTAMYLFSSRRVELLTADPTADLVSAAGRRTTTDRPSTVLQFIGFNAQTGIFAQAQARAAFSRGIQREMVVDAFLSGHAIPAEFPISPLSPLYPAELERSYAYEDTLSALRAAGQSTGEPKELILLVNEENSFRLANAQFIAENLSLLDWTITVRALPWEEYLAALAAGDFDLYYGEARLTADWDLWDLVGSTGALNYGGYVNEAMDLALSRFAGASDRQTAARQLCGLLQTDAPIAPICFKNYTVLTHPGVVEGLAPAPGDTLAHLSDWTIHLAN